tara:strand:+ start:117 stop:959 length:843 start_codon:yes stop_codon:yes gene_type:complete
MPKAIFYYQTFYDNDNNFISIKPVIYEGSPLTHIHLSSIHFGFNNDSSRYIHLNNRTPNNQYFDKVWQDIKFAKSKGIKIIAMIGGAGGGFSTLFRDYKDFYPILRDFLREYSIIDGVDLDIEESCRLSDIKDLINSIVKDFGEDYIIATAPVSSSLITNNPGMGGFCYKDLLNSAEGRYIDYINCQAYFGFNKDTLDEIIKNGYSSEQIVMGMIAGEDYKDELKTLYDSYKNKFGGIFVWEYYNTLPSPQEWCKYVQDVFDDKIIYEPKNTSSKYCIIS